MAIDLIRARHPPLEGAMEEDDGEVELTLGLSVGGSSRKAPRAAAAAAQGRPAELKPADAEFDLGASGSSPSSSRRGPPFCHTDGEGGGGGVAAALDQAKRREIHALRRREARRKRDEKKQQQQQKQRRGIYRETSGAAPGPCGVLPPLEMGCSSDDRLLMEARERQVRAKDREARIEEALDSVPNHKLSANYSTNPNADANSNSGPNSIHSNPDLLPFAAQSFPMVAMPYSYPHLQYVPTTNGFGISCMMPCWPPGMSPAAERPSADGNVFQPIAFRAFRPYSLPVVEPGNRDSPQSSNAVEPNAGTDTGVEGAPSWTASQGSSSSPAASGHRSGSLRGICCSLSAPLLFRLLLCLLCASLPMLLLFVITSPFDGEKERLICFPVFGVHKKSRPSSNGSTKSRINRRDGQR